MPLAQLIYSSKITIDAPSREKELASILETAVRMNNAAHITGCLGHSTDWFLQVLEGEQDDVLQTFLRIEQDHRHSDVKILVNRDIRGRSFPNWSMAFVDLNDAASVYLADYGINGQLSPELTPPSQLQLILMELADRQRLKR
jgi:Sensors of blue-light using FAD